MFLIVRNCCELIFILGQNMVKNAPFGNIEAMMTCAKDRI
jgi:hypothetical protein